MNATSGHHTHQRLKVGAIGLAIMVVLIVIAGAVLGSVSRSRPATRADLAANIQLANQDAAAEPLAELGVAPKADENQAVAQR